MSTVTGKYRKGKVVLDTKVDWPEDVPVEVSTVEEKIGMTESEWPTTPEGLAALLAKVDSFEPVVLTPEEEAAWNAALAESDRVSMEDVRKQMGL